MSEKDDSDYQEWLSTPYARKTAPKHRERARQLHMALEAVCEESTDPKVTRALTLWRSQDSLANLFEGPRGKA